MSTPENENTTPEEEPIFEPFPKPVTVPEGWDLTGLTTEQGPAPETQSDEASKA